MILLHLLAHITPIDMTFILGFLLGIPLYDWLKSKFRKGKGACCKK